MPAIVLAALYLAPTPVAFDRDDARTSGRAVVKTKASLAFVFRLLCAILAPRTGAAFLFAYVTLPAAAAERVVARPLQSVVLAKTLGALVSIVGATAAVRWDLPYATASTAGELAVADTAILLAALMRTRGARRDSGTRTDATSDAWCGRGSHRLGVRLPRI